MFRRIDRKLAATLVILLSHQPSEATFSVTDFGQKTSECLTQSATDCRLQGLGIAAGTTDTTVSSDTERRDGPTDGGEPLV